MFLFEKKENITVKDKISKIIIKERLVGIEKAGARRIFNAMKNSTPASPKRK